MTVSVSHFCENSDTPTVKMTDFRERKIPHLARLSVVLWSAIVVVSLRLTKATCFHLPLVL